MFSLNQLRKRPSFEFDNYLSIHSIEYQLTITYSSKKNSIVECKNKIFLNVICCMIHDANLANHY